MTAADEQTYARGLYDALIGSTLTTLQTVAPKLAHATGSLEALQTQIDAALPPNTPVTIRNFLMVLARDGMLEQLPQVLKAFEQFGAGAATLTRAEVLSAVPLSSEQQERVRQQLQEQYQTPLDLHFRVDETIIGGLIIRVGDQVVDNSLRTRLNNVQRGMLAS